MTGIHMAERTKTMRKTSTMAMLTKATAASKSTTASQAPRQLAGAESQDIQAPRTGSQDIQAACKKGDMALSTTEANEAKGLLK